MAMKDCFHWQLFADPVKPSRCNTVPVKPVSGINKDVCGAKLLPTTASAHPVDCVCFCHLLKTDHCCLCQNERYNPTPAAHPLHPSHPLLTHATYDNTVAEKKVAQNPAVLAS